jgi:CDP-glucose 4,6-dehydratase
MSVVQVVQALRATMGRTDLEPVILNEATHEITRQYLDCAKARQRLGWRPAFTFEQGLDEAIGWYRDWLGRKTG